MTKPGGKLLGKAAFLIRTSSLIRHSSFVIRHSSHADHCSTAEPQLARANVPARDRGRLVDHTQALQEYDFSPDQSDDGIPGTKVGSKFARSLSRRARARARHGWPRSLRRLSTLRVHLPAARDQNHSWRNFKERSICESRKIS